MVFTTEPTFPHFSIRTFPCFLSSKTRRGLFAAAAPDNVYSMPKTILPPPSIDKRIGKIFVVNRERNGYVAVLRLLGGAVIVATVRTDGALVALRCVHLQQGSRLSMQTHGVRTLGLETSDPR